MSDIGRLVRGGTEAVNRLVMATIHDVGHCRFQGLVVLSLRFTLLGLNTIHRVDCAVTFALVSFYFDDALAALVDVIRACVD